MGFIYSRKVHTYKNQNFDLPYRVNLTCLSLPKANEIPIAINVTEEYFFHSNLMSL